MRAIIIVLLVALLPAVSSAEGREMLTFKQVYDLCDASPMHYDISLLDSMSYDSIYSYIKRNGYEEPLTVMGRMKDNDSSKPSRIVATGYYQVKQDGRLILKRYQLSPTADSILADETKYGPASQPEILRGMLEKALASDSHNSNLMTRLGNTYYIQKEYKRAMPWFERSLAENYYDYQAHWFIADCYYHLSDVRDRQGYKKKALREIITALVLNRDHGWIKGSVERICRDSHLKYVEMSFVPECFIRRIADTVKVASTKDWLGYALTKAVMLNEPTLMDTTDIDTIVNTMHPDMLRNSGAEINCLLNLVAGYYGDDPDKECSDPAIANAFAAMKSKQGLECVLYENWLRKVPQLIYCFPQEKVEQLVDYVMKAHLADD
jgi:tetratricopeptide (TPR) repeat protein